MARRVVQSDDEEPDTGNAGGSGTNERATHSIKVKKERKSSARYDGDGHRSDQDEDEAARGNKRQRVNEAGDSRATSPGPNDEGPSESQDAPVKVQKTLSRDKDGYIPGSIVRIQLANFVTYDYAEFFPGPYLNMIIGPNGTGKSSIACAIALGLNFPPKVLGRADEIRSFVKRREEKRKEDRLKPQGPSYIEIELKGKPGRGNCTIRRTLSAENNKSSFTINGEAATGREVDNMMADLNVQVGNLCTFLPQDKVASFAAMSPTDLLVETQKAAGDPQLSNWFEFLKEEGKVNLDLKRKLKSTQEEHDQLEERNNNIKDEVDRFHERRNIEKEIAVLEVILPMQQYREMMQEHREQRTVKKRLAKKVKALVEENAPVSEKLAELKKVVDNASSIRTKKKNALTLSVQKLQKVYDASEKQGDAAAEIHRDIDALKKRESERAAKVRGKQKNIEKMEADLNAPPPDVGATGEQLLAEGRDLRSQREKLVEAMEADKKRMDELIRDKHAADVEIQNLSGSIARLASPDSQKLTALQKMDSDTYHAVLWLRQNRKRFKEEIFEPPILSMSVNNMELADQLEACMNFTQLKTFVAQNQEDLDTLNKCINDQKVNGRSIRIATWYRKPNWDAIPGVPLSDEEMRELGFQGYALQYFNYPKGMEYWLRQDGLHRTPVSNRQVDVGKAMEYICRPCQNSSGGGSFVSGHTMNQITRSRYGNRVATNVTRDIAPARCFRHAPVDLVRKGQLECEIVNQEKIKEKLQEDIDKLDKKLNDQEPGNQKLLNQLAEIKKKMHVLKEDESMRKAFWGKLRRAKDELERLLQEPSVDSQRRQLKAKLLKVCIARVQSARDLAETSRKIIDQQTEASMAAIQTQQADANFRHLKAVHQEKLTKLEKAQNECKEAEDRVQYLKEKCAEFFDSMQDLVNNIDDEMTIKVNEYEKNANEYNNALETAKKNRAPLPDPKEYRHRSADEFSMELEGLRTSLEMLNSTQPGVVEEYERQKRRMAELARTIEQLEGQIRSSDKKINSTKKRWRPALDRLVQSIGKKFSDTFHRSGCAGEVRVFEDEENYEKWAIHIYVKFRDSERLQLLTGQRQSGGERSLTTIMYLMALTEEARAPFSLVDEINQGMDQRAERLVHNTMVKVTCNEDSAQYFLITPKLLTDLRYHERMKVLCVNNGEWLPENGSQQRLGNMMGLIESCLEHRRAGQAVSA